VHETPIIERPSITRFESRGPASAALLLALQNADAHGGNHFKAFASTLDAAVGACLDVVDDDDIQLTLFILYGLYFGDVVLSDAVSEWNPVLVAARLHIERVFERELRYRVPMPELPACNSGAVAAALFALTGAEGGPSLSKYVARTANKEQLRELLVQKSIYTLKEADPHSLAIPRLRGRAKAALVEIQADEYGGGRPGRVHAEIFATTLRAMQLDATYGAYVDNVEAVNLASFNMMSMFGINRRLRGAIVGHLAAFEMTSSVPNRYYGNGFRRLGYGREVTWYFDEHVEADAVHEQIAGHDLAGSLAEDEPLLLADIMFGAAACLYMDELTGQRILGAWERGNTSLRKPL
jgi:hypothetical protein